MKTVQLSNVLKILKVTGLSALAFTLHQGMGLADDYLFEEDRFVSWAPRGYKVLDLKTAALLLPQGKTVNGCVVTSSSYEDNKVTDGTIWDRSADQTRKDLRITIESSEGKKLNFHAFVWPQTALSSFQSNEFVLFPKVDSGVALAGFPEGIDFLVYSGETESPWKVEYARLELAVNDGEVVGLRASITPTKWEGIPFVVGANVPQPDKAKVVECL